MSRILLLFVVSGLTACQHEETACDALRYQCTFRDQLVTDRFGADRALACQHVADARDEAQCASRLTSCRDACTSPVHTTESEVQGCFGHGAGAERQVLCLGSESDSRSYALWEGPAHAEGEPVRRGTFEIMEWSDILWLSGGPVATCANIRFAPSYGLLTGPLIQGLRVDACYPPRDDLSVGWTPVERP